MGLNYAPKGRPKSGDVDPIAQILPRARRVLQKKEPSDVVPLIAQSLTLLLDELDRARQSEAVLLKDQARSPSEVEQEVLQLRRDVVTANERNKFLALDRQRLQSQTTQACGHEKVLRESERNVTYFKTELEEADMQHERELREIKERHGLECDELRRKLAAAELNQSHAYVGADAPRTSQQAAKRVILLGTATSQRTKVLRTIAASAAGLIDDEVAQKLSMLAPRVASRRNELETAAFVALSGEIRKTRTGANARVFQVTEKGLDALRAIDDVNEGEK